MNFVVQSSSISDEATKDLLDKLHGLGVSYQTIGMIPFTEKIIGIEEVDPEADNVFYGSTKLVELLKDSTFSRGIFYNDNFNTEVWNKNRGDMLNSDNVVTSLKDFLTFKGEYFVRPIEDLKKFKGQVVDKEKEKWYDDISHGGYSLDLNTLVSVSPVQPIVMEFRFFIINGIGVTGSLYKRFSRLESYLVTELEELKPFTDQWLPHQNVVMDIAILEDQSKKVIEFNCLNASGFYACDVEKIIGALGESDRPRLSV